MEDKSSMQCRDAARRDEIRRDSDFHGIDYVKVVVDSPEDNQLVLEVHFIEKSSGKDAWREMFEDLDGAVDRITIKGGIRIRNIRVIEVTAVGTGIGTEDVVYEYLKIRVDKRGDFSKYTLCITHGDLDPVYAQCEFSFKAACPSEFDCYQETVCTWDSGDEPDIDYLVKDYAGFRQALLDLITLRIPDWQERHEADLGIALVELLSYAADSLSYYQDAVSNEAYLETARQRISVKRHARLVDYRMHDGAAARAFVHIRLANGTSGLLPAKTRFLTRINTPLRSYTPPHGPILPVDVAAEATAAADVVFEAVQGVSLDARLNEIEFYTWGNKQCCLPRGATTADLMSDLTDVLGPGDFLLFEEVRGPETGQAADADPEHRQIVRLTDVQHTFDSLFEKDVTRVTWDTEDALAFPLCISTRRDDTVTMEGISVARGNLVLADHGNTISNEEHAGPVKPDHANLRRAHRVKLEKGPLSFRADPLVNKASVKEMMRIGTGYLHNARPQIDMTIKTKRGVSSTWTAVTDLLDSNRFDYHFVPEIDNDGRAVIRFGLSRFGMAPPEDSTIYVDYRIGVGTRGNVGSESIVHVIPPNGNTDWPDVEDVRNPLAAWGGIDPEPIRQVKELAPAAFHVDTFRAVTEADYEFFAKEHDKVSNAIATFRWTGSWHTVFLTIDPKDRTDLPPDLQQDIKDWVARFAQTGYDLEIDPPVFAPLHIAIELCLSPDHFRGHVKQAVLEALSNREYSDGRRGFFHAENFTFGESLYLSRLYSAVGAVEGVDSAEVTKFKRFSKVEAGELENGLIPMDRLEVVRLDNDPNFPENGVLELTLRGGK